MKHLPSLRNLVVSAVAASAVAMAIGGVSFASAGGSSASRHTITLNEVVTNSAFVSISHTQNGAPGDGFILRSKLINGDGRRVGTLDINCTEVFGNRSQCVGTFSLPGGTITGSALVPNNGNAPTHIAISGGTGRYAHVSGQGISYTTGQNTNRDVLELTY
jgi:hypothetical protein